MDPFDIDYRSYKLDTPFLSLRDNHMPSILTVLFVLGYSVIKVKILEVSDFFTIFTPLSFQVRNQSNLKFD